MYIQIIYTCKWKKLKKALEDEKTSSPHSLFRRINCVKISTLVKAHYTLNAVLINMTLTFFTNRVEKC